MPTAVRGTQSTAPRQAIVVLGMHRSGTSALTRVVNLLGASEPKTLLKPASDNPFGFWESEPLVSAHEEMLQSAGSYWHDWRPFNPQWFGSPVAKHHKERLKAVIEKEFDDNPFLVIKDPRICRFVPFFLSVLNELEIRVSVLLSLRNPLEVAYSLRRRNGLSLPISLLLWLRHVIEAEHHTRHLPRCVVQYESLLTDWRAVVQQAGDKIGVAWPAFSSDRQLEIDTFLSTEHRNQRSSLDELISHPNAARWVAQTYKLLIDVARTSEDEDAFRQLDSIRAGFDDGCDAFGTAVLAEEIKTAQKQAELDALQARTGGLVDELKSVKEELASCLAQLGLTRRALDLAQTTINIADKKRGDAEQSLLTERQAWAAEQSALHGLTRPIDPAIGEIGPIITTTSSGTESPVSAVPSVQRAILALSVCDVAARTVVPPRSDKGISKPTALRRGLKTVRSGEMTISSILAREALAKELRNSPLFNAAWYVSRRPDVRQAGMHLVDHFVLYGIDEGSSPHPLLDANWLARQGAGHAGAGLWAYFQGGRHAGLDPHALFDAGYYRLVTGLADTDDALLHYVSQAVGQRLSPCPAFDPAYYSRQVPGLDARQVDPLVHYAHSRWSFLTDPHPLFDSAYYRSQIGGLMPAESLLAHYLGEGWRQGHSPHPEFSTRQYLDQHPELMTSGVPPLVHHLKSRETYAGTRAGNAES